MTRFPSPLLRCALAALLLSPSFSAVQAAAQVVDAAAISGASAAGSAAAAAGAVSRAPLALGSAPLLAPSISVKLVPALNVSAAPVSAAFAAAPAAAASAEALVPAASALRAGAAAADGPTPLQEPLRPGEPGDPRLGTGDVMVHDGPRGRMLVPLSSFEQPLAPVDWNSSRSRLNHEFDNAAEHEGAVADAPVAGVRHGWLSSLTKSAPKRTIGSGRETPPEIARTASLRSPRVSFAWKVALGVGLLLLTPGLALAATTAAPLAATAASLSLLASIHPLASAAGAVAGAIYGMFASRPKDGTPASAGETFSSILRYGVLGGAGTYVLLNLTQMAFGASAIGLQPLTSAIAIAALGRTAFQDKFLAPTTTSADRIFGAFPAVAAAVGISVAVGLTATALAVPALSVTIATAAMAATGVAAALFAAIFKPGRSPLNGPERMAKGYVLQALMMGLALAMTNPWLFWPFALMGAAGFGLVMWTTALEVWAHRPGAPAQPLPPAPPTPAPTPVPAPTPKV